MDDGEGDTGARPAELVGAALAGVHGDGRDLDPAQEAPGRDPLRGPGQRRADGRASARVHAVRRRARGRRDRPRSRGGPARHRALRDAVLLRRLDALVRRGRGAPLVPHPPARRRRALRGGASSSARRPRRPPSLRAEARSVCGSPSPVSTFSRRTRSGSGRRPVVARARSGAGGRPLQGSPPRRRSPGERSIRSCGAHSLERPPRERLTSDDPAWSASVLPENV